MQVDTFLKPDWPHKLAHHIWLTGPLEQLKSAEVWVNQWMCDHNVEGGFAGPKCLTPGIIENRLYRLIIMTTTPIDPMILKLSI